MQINQVTLFKMMFFVVCVVLVTILIMKLVAFNATSQNMCQTLVTKMDVEASEILTECPEGSYPNYGKFSDVDKDKRCCVRYKK